MFNLNYLKKERAIKFYFLPISTRNRPSIIYLYSIRNQPILLVNIFFFFDLSLHIKSPSILYHEFKYTLLYQVDIT